jgi:hypothetical protein
MCDGREFGAGMARVYSSVLKDKVGEWFERLDEVVFVVLERIWRSKVVRWFQWLADDGA